MSFFFKIGDFTVPWVLVPFFLFLCTCISYICFSMLPLTVQSRVTIRCGFVTDWTFLVVVLHMYRHSYYYWLSVIVNDCRNRWGICFCAFIYIRVYCADFTTMFYVNIFFVWCLVSLKYWKKESICAKVCCSISHKEFKMFFWLKQSKLTLGSHVTMSLF